MNTKEIPYYGLNLWSFKNRKRKRKNWKPRPAFEATCCKNGHEFTEENTIWLTNKDKKVRQCRICRTKSLVLNRVKRYGLTIKEYNRAFEAQSGLCAICKKNPIKAIDHCHKTNVFRGLLCTNCNMGLGLFMDNKKILKEAINYLDRF